MKVNLLELTKRLKERAKCPAYLVQHERNCWQYVKISEVINTIKELKKEQEKN